MERRDSVDDHLDRWLPLLPNLDPTIEGAVTRMQVLVKHLHKVKEQGLAEYELQDFEFSTLKALAARKGRAAPSELVADLRISPAAMTGRLDTLEERGYVVRRQSSVDRRRVDVELTKAGYDAWESAMGAVGQEERRLMAVLNPVERLRLSTLLHRLLIVAESPDPA